MKRFHRTRPLLMRLSYLAYKYTAVPKSYTPVPNVVCCGIKLFSLWYQSSREVPRYQSSTISYTMKTSFPDFVRAPSHNLFYTAYVPCKIEQRDFQNLCLLFSTITMFIILQLIYFLHIRLQVADWCAVCGEVVGGLVKGWR